MDTKQTLTVVESAVDVMVQKYASRTVIVRKVCVLRTRVWHVTMALKMETKQM